MEPLAFSLAEAFDLARISRAKGYELVRDGKFAPVRYQGGRTIVLRQDLETYLQSLPTERTHKRGGAR
jgi:predicted site-specific integrase-resolvase